MADFSLSFGFEDGPAGDPAALRGVAFLCDPALVGKIPVPERAIRFAPEWFKRLEREMGMPDPNGLPGLTVKACLPVTDAFALGFVLPLPYDVHVRVPEDRVRIALSWPAEAAFAPIEQHHPGQIGAPSPPFETAMPLKFVNPWRITVPPGYSVLFVQPLNRPDLPFTTFAGLVDCDRFETTVNVPFLWTGPVGEHVLRAGTPIAQLIPIRRETLLKDHASRASSDAERAAEAGARQRKYHEQSTYAREWRVKK